MYGETQYVGKKENWTLDEMIERWEQMPEDAVFNGNKTRDSVYREVLAPKLTSFVDIEKGISNFDSSVFLKTLEFINSFPNPEAYKTHIAFHHTKYPLKKTGVLLIILRLFRLISKYFQALSLCLSHYLNLKKDTNQ